MSLQAKVEGVVGEAMARSGVPGAVLGWVTRDGRGGAVAWGRASVAPDVAMRVDHVLHLFSATKLYTASLIALLADEGALDLDAPVTRWLPELQLRHEVTARQLATHASGLPDTLRAFLAVHLPGAPMPTTAEALARYRVDRGRPPGTVAYANVNYAILGALVARVAGRPFAEVLDARLLRPLGSAATLCYTPEQLGRAAVGHHPRWSPGRWIMPLLIPGGRSLGLFGRPSGAFVPLVPYELDGAAIGGLVGEAGDFLPLLRETLDPADGVLSGAAKRELLTVHARGKAGVVSDRGVGLGWKRGEVDGAAYWNHEGGGAGFYTETRIYPDAGVGVVLLANLTQSSRLSRAAHRVCEEVRRSVA